MHVRQYQRSTHSVGVMFGKPSNNQHGGKALANFGMCVNNVEFLKLYRVGIEFFSESKQVKTKELEYCTYSPRRTYFS